jgi:hypothetical protein
MSNNTTRIRGVPTADRARSTTTRPDGCLSGLDPFADADHHGKGHGMTQTHNHPDIAERVGPDTFLLRGRFVNGDELVTDATRALQRDDLIAQLERDTGESLVGLDVHRKALEILAARGLADSYTDEQYLDACKRAGAQ